MSVLFHAVRGRASANDFAHRAISPLYFLFTRLTPHIAPLLRVVTRGYAHCALAHNLCLCTSLRACLTSTPSRIARRSCLLHRLVPRRTCCVARLALVSAPRIAMAAWASAGIISTPIFCSARVGYAPFSRACTARIPLASSAACALRRLFHALLALFLATLAAAL